MLLQDASLPKKVGSVKLEMGKVTQAKREGKCIVLPARARFLEFTALSAHQQFVLVCEEKAKDDTSQIRRYFGGMDESPFLSIVHCEAVTALKNEGESAFYEALKPLWIRNREKRTGISAKRQGDIFAMPVGSGWASLSQRPVFSYEESQGEKIYDVRFHGDYSPMEIDLSIDLPNPTQAKNQVLGTNHQLTGFMRTCVLGDSWNNWQRPSHHSNNNGSLFLYRFDVGEGILEAPDHSPLQLRGLHAFVRAAHHRPEVSPRMMFNSHLVAYLKRMGVNSEQKGIQYYD